MKNKSIQKAFGQRAQANQLLSDPVFDQPNWPIFLCCHRQTRFNGIIVPLNFQPVSTRPVELAQDATVLKNLILDGCSTRLAQTVASWQAACEDQQVSQDVLSRSEEAVLVPRFSVFSPH